MNSDSDEKKKLKLERNYKYLQFMVAILIATTAGFVSLLLGADTDNLRKTFSALALAAMVASSILIIFVVKDTEKLISKFK